VGAEVGAAGTAGASKSARAHGTFVEMMSGVVGCRSIGVAHRHDAAEIGDAVWISIEAVISGSNAREELVEKRWEYVFDGHGSVRALTNAAGAVTDTYDYDAFGNLLHSTGTTPNNYLFAGEQFDPNLNLYYNRARYLSTNTGRFWTMDDDEGNGYEPASLHKYL
jgi:RHS repeat-associated protein